MGYARLLIIDGLFEGGRMFVGATSVTFLLSSGLSVSKVALLKTLQALTFIVFEVPTGLFADLLGRFRSLLMALVCVTLGFSLFFLGRDFVVFSFAEVLCALALCFWSGAYEAYAIDSAKLTLEKGGLDRFFHLNQAVTSFMVLLSGFMGGWLGGHSLRAPFLAGLFMFAAAMLFLLQMPRLEASGTFPSWGTMVERGKASLFQHVKAVYHEGLLNPRLRPYFLAGIGIQFFVQPVLHLWQPLFTSFGTSEGNSGNGVIFAMYCGTSVLAGLAFAQVSRRASVRTNLMTVLLFTSTACFYVLTAHASSWLFGVLFFCILQGLLSVSRTSLTIRMNDLLHSESRATILSSSSLISRFGMVGALVGIQGLERWGWASAPKDIFQLFSWGSLFTVLTLLIFVACSRLRNRSRGEQSGTI